MKQCISRFSLTSALLFTFLIFGISAVYVRPAECASVNTSRSNIKTVIVTFPEVLPPCGSVTIHPSAISVTDVSGVVRPGLVPPGYTAVLSDPCPEGTHTGYIVDDGARNETGINLTSLDGNTEIMLHAEAIQVLDTHTLLPTTLWDGHVIAPGVDTSWTYLATPVPAAGLAALCSLLLLGLVVLRRKSGQQPRA